LKTHEVPENVALFLHCKNKGVGYDLAQLSVWAGISNRVILLGQDIQGSGGVLEDRMKWIYGCLDLQISTTMGEGWGLTTMEGMACGIPQLVSDWSALGEWAREGVELVECTGMSATPGNINTIGGVVDQGEFVYTLDYLYRNPEERRALAERGLTLARDSKFSWDYLASKFDEALRGVLEQRNKVMVERHLTETTPDGADVQDRHNGSPEGSEAPAER